ncbi:MAG: hypothetical protein WAM73_20720, partial [Desulfobacterales bacterium]
QEAIVKIGFKSKILARPEGGGCIDCTPTTDTTAKIFILKPIKASPTLGKHVGLFSWYSPK